MSVFGPPLDHGEHDPTPAQRRQVEALAGYGFAEADIATVMALKSEVLCLHYPGELASGHIKANAKVAENLFRKATGEGRESVIAAIFWLKARARWTESNAHELSGKDGQPIRIEISAADAGL
jgi:hypothetical protein